MAIPRIISDFAGTARSLVKFGLTTAGAALKAVTGGLVVRDVGDTADAPLTASQLRASGDSIEINSDAAGSGDDHKLTLARNADDMTGDVTFVFPADEGSTGQAILKRSDGTTEWGTVGGGATNGVLVDVTAVAYGDSSPVTMFTKPVNGSVQKVEVIIDEEFDGTPSLSIGVSGTTSKYAGTTQIDLTAEVGTVFEITPGVAPTSGTEALIATYSSGSATQGVARILTYYAQPS